MATTKKTETIRKKYVFRITSSKLNPYFRIGGKLNAIQFIEGIYMTDNEEAEDRLDLWVSEGQIELVSEREDMELVLEKSKRTTDEFYGRVPKKAKKNKILDILEG